MSDTLTLPVLPLRDTVVFPGVTTPIGAGRPGTLRAIQAVSGSKEKLVFAVSQRENREMVTPDRLHTIGTVARIGQLQRVTGGVQFLLHGEYRGIALRISESSGDYLEAVVRQAEEMSPSDPADTAFLALQREVRERALELGQKAGFPEDVVKQVLTSAEDSARLADLVAAYLEVPHLERQMLLETLSVEERLRQVLLQVQRQIGVLDAQQDIKSKVQRELGDRQREMVLREQLKAIQEELGETDGDPGIGELKKSLDALDLPPEAQKEVDRELDRLERTNRESMEHQVIRTYLENLAELPWNTRSEDDLDLHRAADILDEDHYGLQDVKDRVLEFLAVRQLQSDRELRQKEKAENELVSDSEILESGPEVAAASMADEAPEDSPATSDRPVEEEDQSSKGPILLFVGPPGVGKTSIAKSIARAMGRKYVRISLGGARDEADIRGHRRTYVGAMPGRIHQGDETGGHEEPGLPARRGRQAGGVLPGRSSERPPRGPGSGPERQLRRSLSRCSIRPVGGVVRHYSQLHPEHPRAPLGPHGDRRVHRLYRTGEVGDRQTLSGASTVDRQRLGRGNSDDHGRGAGRSHRALHP